MDLKDELLCHVIKWLPMDGAKALRLACRHCRQLINGGITSVKVRNFFYQHA